MTDKIIKALKIHSEDKRARIVAMSKEREWMNKSPDKFAYRCLPLAIANQHGWAVYPTKSVSAVWSGGNKPQDVNIVDDPDNIAGGVFGQGVLTFHIMHIINLPENYNLYITGAPNHIIPGIQPLTGVYEADWSPYTFTMNWKITEPNRIITFTENDPICFFFPVPRGLIEEFKFEYDDLSNYPQIEAQHTYFVRSRAEFIASSQEERLKKTNGAGWQKNYFQGKFPDGRKCPVNHQTKLHLDKPDDQIEEDVAEGVEPKSE